MEICQSRSPENEDLGTAKRKFANRGAQKAKNLAPQNWKFQIAEPGLQKTGTAKRKSKNRGARKVKTGLRK